MFHLRRIREDFARARNTPPRLPAPELLRELCMTLLDDIDPEPRDALLQRLNRLRRADDIWDLRSALFDVVSLRHGESVARERLVALDAGMATLPRQAPRRNAWSATVS